MDDNKGVYTSMSNSSLLHQDNGILINDFQHCTNIGKLQYLSLEMSNSYKVEIEIQLERQIKITRYDRGDEYKSIAFDEFSTQNRIIHQKTASYPPKKWSSNKKNNKTLKGRINSLLNSSGLPHNL